MKEKIIAIILLISIVITAFVLSGCNRGEKYSVDYCGQKSVYSGARDSYYAGQEVKLYYSLIATDTDYSFYLDGERLNVDYDERKGFIISFTMPDHDVKLECESRNSMELYVPEYEEGSVLIDYYCETVKASGKNDVYELVLTATDNAYEYKLDVYSKDEDSGEETTVSYLVPYYVFDSCMSIVVANGVDEWNELENGIAMLDKFVSLKFFDGNELVRVSTEKMKDEDGEMVLEIIRSALEDYTVEEYLITEE